MAVEMALLDLMRQDLIEYPFSSVLKSEILNALFGCKFVPADFTRQPTLWGGYFEYYHEQCLAALHNSMLDCLIKNHRDVVEVVNLLQDLEATRETVKEKLRARLPTPEPQNGDELLCDAIDLAARLGLMILVGNFRQVLHAGQRTLSWRDNRLHALLAAEFKTTRLLTEEHVKLEKLFNARNLERIAGIRIIWTSNLADHLRMQEDDTKVSIFHYASFLALQHERYSFSY